jgi:hypothetical protein
MTASTGGEGGGPQFGYLALKGRDPILNGKRFRL